MLDYLFSQSFYIVLDVTCRIAIVSFIIGIVIGLIVQILDTFDIGVGLYSGKNNDYNDYEYMSSKILTVIGMGLTLLSFFVMNGAVFLTFIFHPNMIF